MRRFVFLCAALIFGCSSETGAADDGGLVADEGVTDAGGAETIADAVTETNGETAVVDSSAVDAKPDSAKPDSAADSSSPDTFVADSGTDSGSSDTGESDGGEGDSGGAVDSSTAILNCSGATGSGLTCDLGTQVCCWNEDFGGDGVCKSTLSSCASGSSRIYCAGAADCPSGQVCCANKVSGGTGRFLGTECETTCTPIGAGYDAWEVCSWRFPVAGECPAGKSCAATGPPFGWCL